MADKTIVDYEQLRSISKKFSNEGEALAQLTAQVRQSVHNLKSEWIGAGSDAFFEEMETEILPALKRLHEAMTFSAETVNIINKLYRSAEEEGSNVIKNYDGSSQGVGSFDYGASEFSNLGGIGGIGGTVGDADFGASEFENLAGGGAPGETGGGIGEADYGASDFDNLSGTSSGGGSGLNESDFGASEFENLSESGGGGEGSQATPQESQQQQEVKMDAGESSAGGSGGGGTGGGSSSGLQGDLSEMGNGLTDSESRGSSAGGGDSGGVGGGTPMPDHVYQSGGSTGDSGGSPGTSAAPPPSSAPTETSQEGEGISAAGTAGVVGGVGAAAGAAKKVVKDKDQK
jgi:WXG100 family type VII secretion target